MSAATVRPRHGPAPIGTRLLPEPASDPWPHWAPRPTPPTPRTGHALTVALRTHLERLGLDADEVATVLADPTPPTDRAWRDTAACREVDSATSHRLTDARDQLGATDLLRDLCR